MYQLLALITGVTLAVMVSVNGNLSRQYGVFPAAVIVHVVGVLFAFLLCILRKEKRTLRGHSPVWIYLGGVIGVFTTVFNNFAFGYISMTSIIALGLLGQMVTAQIIDHFGLFGMERRPFRKVSLIGWIFSLFGIFLMLDRSAAAAVFAVCLSFGAGISVVLSRTVNARLAEKVGALRGSLVNHLVGLPVTVIIAVFAARAVFPAADPVISPPPWIYFGGALGVISVLLCNLTVPRISAFLLTVLTFVGQVFTGILLDSVTGGGYSNATFAGGITIAAGIAVNLIAEQVVLVRERKQTACLERLRRTEDEYQRRLVEKYRHKKITV
ncbi:DMT family transporter [Breznakiella homolactica]|uniref:DMT family transporter n=1 Tax=Breznakiella homolactica TaxID=2798577 RepID=A0A7T7XLP6_9SPIR|nr:DMT family transporter [Breznakiella homolactica]QQO08685.1 DMT family transporter [Breznakiella homolactica]